MSATGHGLAQRSQLLQAAWHSSKHTRHRIPASIYNNARHSLQVRFQSSNASGHDNTSWLHRNSNVRVSTLLTVLLAIGGGATALGLYEFYTSFTLWPVELRKDLRAGIRTKNQGDHAVSERFLGRAYQTALTLPISVLGPDPYLKLSGIAAVLAEVAPERRAKEVLRNVWERGDPSFSHSRPDSESTSSKSESLQESESAAVDNENGWSSYKLTNEERLRRVAVACRLAELNEGTDEEEKWLVWAVEEVLRLAGVQAQSSTNTNANSGTTPGDANDGLDSNSKSVLLAELELPKWMRKADLGAPLAALGAVYARKDNVDYAMPLYLQAISLLLPPNTQNVSIDDRCQAAQLMNNLSELIMRRPPTPQIRHQAESWARQSHSVIEHALAMPLPSHRKRWFTSSGDESNAGGREVCDQALGVVLFNLGMLREMDEDRKTARALYEQSVRQCERVGMREGVMQAKQALRRVGRAEVSRESSS